MRRALLAIVLTSVLAALTVALRSSGRVEWQAEGERLALPALLPADRALVRAAEEVIRAA